MIALEFAYDDERSLLSFFLSLFLPLSLSPSLLLYLSVSLCFCVCLAHIGIPVLSVCLSNYLSTCHRNSTSFFLIKQRFCLSFLMSVCLSASVCISMHFLYLSLSFPVYLIICFRLLIDGTATSSSKRPSSAKSAAGVAPGVVRRHQSSTEAGGCDAAIAEAGAYTSHSSSSSSSSSLAARDNVDSSRIGRGLHKQEAVGGRGGGGTEVEGGGAVEAPSTCCSR